jgi:hypothetical protein
LDMEDGDRHFGFTYIIQYTIKTDIPHIQITIHPTNLDLWIMINLYLN